MKVGALAGPALLFGFWDSVGENVVAGLVLLPPSVIAGGWAGAWFERLVGRLKNQWLWELTSPQDVTIALAASAKTRTSGSRSGTTYQRPATGSGPARALAALMPSLCRGYASLGAQHIKLSGDISSEERKGDLICLGGVATNSETRSVLDSLDRATLPFAIGGSKQIRWNPPQGGTQVYEGEVGGDGKVKRDYGVVVRVPNPHDRERGAAFVFAGSRTYGTIAAAEYFADRRISVLEKVLLRKRPFPRYFAALVTAEVEDETVKNVKLCGDVVALDMIGSSTRNRSPGQIEVVERHVQSKSGVEDECEDLIVVTPHYAGVIDGETDKTGLRYAGKTGGRFVAEQIATVIEELPPDADIDHCVSRMRGRLRHIRPDGQDPSGRAATPSAVFALYSVAREEIWRVGDVSIVVDGVIYPSSRALDTLVGEARAALLHAALEAGANERELEEEDPGRAMMLPLLERQHVFRNDVGSPYGFGAIDGGAVPREFRERFPVSGAASVVIASDGYPEPKETLAESERALEARIGDDPLLLGPPAATKGMKPGASSFDDRSYLRLRLGGR